MLKPILSLSAAAFIALSISGCSPSTPQETVIQASANTESSESADTAHPGTAEETVAANSNATVVQDSDYSLDDATDYQGGSITTAGVYRITGQHDQIVVNAPDDARVVLILDNATVTSDTGPAIDIENADDVAVVSRGQSSVTGAGSEEAPAALYSAADLTLAGDGTLTVKATADGMDAIASSDDLAVVSGTIEATADDDGLRGTDSLTISGGNVTATTTHGDALKSSKDDDATKGWVRITGGTVNADAGDDAIAATTDVIVEGGTITAKSADKAITAGAYVVASGGHVTADAQDDGIHSDGAVRLSGGDFTIGSGDDGVHAEVASVLDGANLTVTRSEEALEAGLITISSGDINLTSSDDGINASGSTTAEAGAQAVATKSAESTESSTEETDRGQAPNGAPEAPTGQGGSVPDGLGQGGPGQGGPGQGDFGQGGAGQGAPGGPMGDESTGEQLNISGGTVTVNAGGDGIDSNGDATMTGGTVTVWGPTDNGNGALDVAGSLSVTGGTLTAVGSAGMATTPTSTDGQGWIGAAVSGSAGDEIVISDSSGAEVARLSATKNFGHVVYSDARIVQGQVYTVSVGGNSVSATAGEATHGSMGGAGRPGEADRPRGADKA